MAAPRNIDLPIMFSGGRHTLNPTAIYQLIEVTSRYIPYYPLSTPRPCVVPPPPKGRKAVKTLCYPREMNFNLFVLTKSPLSLWYPRGQHYDKNKCPPPRGVAQKTTSPRGENITISAVLRSAPLRFACNEQCAFDRCCCLLFVVRCLII